MTNNNNNNPLSFPDWQSKEKHLINHHWNKYKANKHAIEVKVSSYPEQRKYPTNILIAKMEEFIKYLKDNNSLAATIIEYDNQLQFIAYNKESNKSIEEYKQQWLEEHYRSYIMNFYQNKGYDHMNNYYQNKIKNNKRTSNTGPK
jgi:hypothetical protein